MSGTALSGTALGSATLVTAGMPADAQAARTCGEARGAYIQGFLAMLAYIQGFLAMLAYIQGFLAMLAYIQGFFAMPAYIHGLRLAAQGRAVSARSQRARLTAG